MLVGSKEIERKKVLWVKKHLKTKKNVVGNNTYNISVDVNAFGTIMFEGAHNKTRSKVIFLTFCRSSCLEVLRIEAVLKIPKII